MRRAVVFSVVCCFIMAPATGFATLPADIDASQHVDLRDIITRLQVLAGLPTLPYDYLLMESDPDGDGYSTDASLAVYETPTEFHFPEADMISHYGDVDDEDPDVHPDL